MWRSEGGITRDASVVRFSRALCRTRTGNPFLTMAVRPWRGIRCTEPKRLHSPAKRDPADCCTDAHTSAPSGTAWVPWFRTAPPPAALDGGIQSRRTRDVTERPGGRGTVWVICSAAAARPGGIHQGVRALAGRSPSRWAGRRAAHDPSRGRSWRDRLDAERDRGFAGEERRKSRARGSDALHSPRARLASVKRTVRPGLAFSGYA